jgi:outer membrane PBP1 activator LpoA protein
VANGTENIDSMIQSISSELSPEEIAKAEDAASRIKEQGASQEMLRFRMFAADSGDQR